MTRDRLFIFLAIVLLILFAAEIYLNLPRPNLGMDAKVRPRQERQENIAGILARLEQAGLEPQEAKYYRVIE